MEQIGSIYRIFNNRPAIVYLIDALQKEGFEVERSTAFEDRGAENYIIGEPGKPGSGKILSSEGRVHSESSPHLDEFLSRFDLEQTPYGCFRKRALIHQNPPNSQPTKTP